MVGDIHLLVIILNGLMDQPGKMNSLEKDHLIVVKIGIISEKVESFGISKMEEVYSWICSQKTKMNIGIQMEMESEIIPIQILMEMVSLTKKSLPLEVTDIHTGMNIPEEV